MDDIFHDISRKSSRLHCSRLSAHVHQDQGHAVARGYFGNLWIASQPGHVVDEFCSRADCDLSDAGPARVHRNGSSQASAERFKDRKNAIQLFTGRRLHGSGPRRFAADVEQVGASALDGIGLLDCAVGLQEFAGVGKAVRRHVQHAHDQRAFAEDQRARIESEAKEFAPNHER